MDLEITWKIKCKIATNKIWGDAHYSGILNRPRPWDFFPNLNCDLFKVIFWTLTAIKESAKNCDSNGQRSNIFKLCSKDMALKPYSNQSM